MEFRQAVYEGRHAMVPISPYNYAPLSRGDNEIRLVEIQQSQNNEGTIERLKP